MGRRGPRVDEQTGAGRGGRLEQLQREGRVGHQQIAGALPAASVYAGGVNDDVDPVEHCERAGDPILADVDQRQVAERFQPPEVRCGALENGNVPPRVGEGAGKAAAEVARPAKNDDLFG